MQMLRKVLLLVLLPLLLLCALLEALGHVVNPAPAEDSVAAINARLSAQIYEHDPDLTVRLRPNQRGSLRGLRTDLFAEFTVNAHGFRGPAAHGPPDPDALRVLVLGDSVTFGHGVGDAETWPAVLQQRLQARAGARAVQVRNLGVPGYSTVQGRILLERHATVSGFAPHVVVAAFGFNDGYLRPSDELRTREAERFRHAHPLGIALRWLTEHSRFCAWLLVQRGEPSTPRVPLPLLHDGLEAMAALARARGFELILADASLPHGYARAAIRATAERHRLPWLAFREAFRVAQQLPEEGPWPQGGTLRVEVPAHGFVPPVPAGGGAALVLLATLEPGQRATPRQVPLRDDGAAGDTSAGDGLWSCTLDIPDGAAPELAVWIPGIAAQLPYMATAGDCVNGVHWARPGPRLPDTPPLRLDVAQICPWPDLVLLPDVIHPNAKGQAVLADAVAAAVVATGAWQRLAR